MNYINPTLETPQMLAINCNTAAGSSISWTLTKEGDDSTTFSFTSPSANFTLTDMGYFQALTADFFSEGIDLDPEHTYLLKGAANGSDVYVGKVFVSEQNIESYTVHPSKYTETVASNNYIILD
jgi:hypothetical protein